MVMLILIGILGAAFGSFAGAQVWRLRARQLVEDKKAGEKVSAKELKKLSPLIKKVSKDRSRCLSCGHVLAWYDLIPLVSWLSLRGKCRYCKKFIGWTEFLLEVGMAALFALSVVLWPMPLASFWQILTLVLWLAALVLLAILFVYDLKWLLLPDIVNIPFIVLGAVFAGIKLCLASDVTSALTSLLGAVFVLSGIYLLLYLFSKAHYGEDKTWVGFGDVKLGLGLSLFLGNWLLAFAALFAANLIGTILVLPSMLTGKLRGNSRISFGPLLIAGFLIVWLFSESILNWYQFIL
ncbi:prepilin peptidase [TM7 phylum sp. oral taxon 353]|jgi:prepilin signal peptidase PulO-like enzyme (type II secretory pathway)|nr:prepilin peptidase [TM7 phylum sp. oral taxon 353]